MFGRILLLFGGRSRNRGRAQRVKKCVCPICGYSIHHKKGISCCSLQCPKCHVSLLPDKLAATSLSKESPGSVGNRMNDKSSIDFPIINKGLCKGCGKCINTCPKGAINLVNNIAVIDYSKCKKCRLCVRECPMNAIS